ncbi:MAG TPA: hypothetical protein VI932_07720 [Bacteroidota bacterium]|nr:hypothetical protein [Bacteroidota bacterium]
MIHTALFAIFALAGALFSPAPPPGPPPPAGERGIDTAVVHLLRSTPTTRTYEVNLVVEPGDTIRSMVRRPRPSPGPSDNTHPLAFLVVGIETGKDVVELIEGHDGVVVFGMDYPFEGNFDLSGWGSFGTAFSLRQMAYRTVRNVHLALDWLTRLPEVDTSDVTMIAVSFGVFTGVPAAAADPRIKRLAVVQGGGQIDDVIETNSERLGIPLPAWLAGKIGRGILSPFEPNDHVGAFAPRPFILVSGESDRFFPKESVQSLYNAAGEPKEWIRHAHPHVMPDERGLIRELTKVLAEKLYGRK